MHLVYHYVRLTCLSILGSLAPLSSAAAQTAGADDTLSLAFRTAFAAELDAVIRARFAHWEGVPGLQGARYDSLALDYRQRVVATNDRWMFGMSTMRFLGALQNGHTTYFDPWMARRHGAWQGFRLRFDSAGWVVTSSQRPELAAGDRVALIDSQPFERFFQQQRRYLMNSGERAARHALSGASHLFPPAFTLTLADGRVVHIVRTPITSSANRIASTAGPVARTAVASRVAARWLVPDSIAYLRLTTFGDAGETEREALRAVRSEFAKAQAIVFDVRDNGGGQTPWRLIKALTGNAFAGFRYRPDNLKAASWYQRVGARLVRTGRYRGRVAVLANIGCASACENFVMALQESVGATFVGDTTWGSTGQPVFVDRENGIVARVSARRAIGRNGATFEGVGLIPDVVVPLPIRQVGRDPDPVVERVIAVLRQTAPR